MKKAARRARLRHRQVDRMARENELLFEYVVATAARDAIRAFQRQQAWFRVVAGSAYIYAVLVATVGLPPKVIELDPELSDSPPLSPSWAVEV